MTNAYDETLIRQARASDPRANAWVAANAGTGKTHVLTQRVIRLLIDGTKPERILCLTFTKAAAAEMANRLFTTLGEWATSSDTKLKQTVEDVTRAPASTKILTRVRRLFAQALETPGGLKIQTIHAFCERLLKRFPLEARVPPFFDVLDERLSEDLLSQARQELLIQALDETHTGLNQALGHIIIHVDEFGLDALLGEVVKKRRSLTDWLAKAGSLDSALEHMARELGVRPDETQNDFLRSACMEPQFPRDAMAHAVHALALGTKRDKDAAASIERFISATDPAAAFEDYARAFLTTKDSPRVDLVTKGMQEKFPDLEVTLRAEQARVLDVLAHSKALGVFEATKNLAILSERLLSIYQEKKRESGALDYDDLILKSRDLLTQSQAASWVLYKLDGGINHILVDEAQDTSPEQWQVIEALAEEFFAGHGAHEAEALEAPRTIFAVGDEKQSIFSFQGADPDMFHEMMMRFADRVESARQIWSPVDLTLSFRSTHQVLCAVDSIFQADALAQSLTASGQIVHHHPKRIGAAGLVELWPVVEPEKSEDTPAWDAPFDQKRNSHPRTLLAERIAACIDRWISDKTILESQGRPIRGGDILILLRRRSHFMDDLVRALKRRGLPVAGADRLALTEQLAVMDLMTLAAFALLHRDDLTLATVLKSPLIGISEEDLFRLAHGRPSSLWQALGRRAERDPTGIYAKAHDALNRIVRRVNFTPPYEFFQHIMAEKWMGSGKTGRELLIGRLGRDSEDPLDEFLSLALRFEKYNKPSLQNFLHWMSVNDPVLKREHDLGKDEVRVMTVHGSKGLEGNIVFLPDTCNLPDGKNDSNILELTHGGFVYARSKKNDDPVTQETRAEMAKKRSAEYHRLLYVAATRARDRLYIAGYVGNRPRSARCWYDLIATALKPLATPVPLFFGETGWRLAGKQDPDAVESDKTLSPAAREIQRAPEWVNHPAPLESPRVRPLSPSSLSRARQETEGPALSPLAGDTKARFARGLLIHKLLETMPGLPPIERAAAATRFLAQKAQDFSAQERAVMVREIIAILTEKDFAPVFGPDSQAEVRLFGTLPGLAPLSGQIDRLVIAEDKILVIDYKTNRPPPQTPEDVSPLYLRQMAVYQALLAEAFPGRAIFCALLWTDGPHLMKLPQFLLDQAMREIQGHAGP